MPSNKVIPVELTIAQGATESDVKEVQHPVDGAYAIAGLRLQTAITSVAARLQMNSVETAASFADVFDQYGVTRTVPLAAAGYYTLPVGEFAVIDRFIRLKLAAGASVATKVTVFLRVA